METVTSVEDKLLGNSLSPLISTLLTACLAGFRLEACAFISLSKVSHVVDFTRALFSGRVLD